MAVIGAPESVVGIAATSPPRTAATAFAESITRPPPKATMRSLPMSSTIAAEASGTPPGATRCDAAGGLAESRGVSERAGGREQLELAPALLPERSERIGDGPAVEEQLPPIVGELEPGSLYGAASDRRRTRARSGTRTHSRRLTKPMLCQLSYPGERNRVGASQPERYRRTGERGRAYSPAWLRPATSNESLSDPSAAAARGRWLARGAWLLAAAEVVLAVRNHVIAADEKDRQRMVEIVKASKGRPSNLSDRQRKELKALLAKAEPRELAKTVATSGFASRFTRGIRRK